jgi:type III secretion protein T
VDFLSTTPPFERLHDYIMALGFVMARMTGLIIVMPAFTRLGLTGILRGATAFVFALPLVPMVVAALAREHLTLMTIAALLPKEVVIGVMIGLVLGVPIWAAEAAGSILDVQRGSSAASLFDPLGADDASITGTLLALVMVALYFGSGGLSLTLRTVYESYGIWPVVNVLPALSPATGEFFLVLLDNVIVMGLMLVAPIVVFMLLTCSRWCRGQPPTSMSSRFRSVRKISSSRCCWCSTAPSCSSTWGTTSVRSCMREAISKNWPGRRPGRPQRAFRSINWLRLS